MILLELFIMFIAASAVFGLHFLFKRLKEQQIKK